MIISLIAALDDKGGMGLNGGLPWPHNPADMKWFREATMGKVVIVGSVTAATLPELPGRTVVTVDRHDTPLEIIEMLENQGVQEAVVIGGARTYITWLPYVDRFLIGRIRGEYECDTYCEELKIWE